MYYRKVRVNPIINNIKLLLLPLSLLLLLLFQNTVKKIELEKLSLEIEEKTDQVFYLPP